MTSFFLKVFSSLCLTILGSLLHAKMPDVDISFYGQQAVVVKNKDGQSSLKIEITNHENQVIVLERAIAGCSCAERGNEIVEIAPNKKETVSFEIDMMTSPGVKSIDFAFKFRKYDSVIRKRFVFYLLPKERLYLPNKVTDITSSPDSKKFITIVGFIDSLSSISLEHSKNISTNILFSRKNKKFPALNTIVLELGVAEGRAIDSPELLKVIHRGTTVNHIIK